MSPDRTASGVPYDPAALDEVERMFWRGIWNAVPGGIAERHGVQARDFGPVQGTIVSALPEARMLNLVLGATEPAAVSAGHLERALDWAESLDVSFYVPVKESGGPRRSSAYLEPAAMGAAIRG